MKETLTEVRGLPRNFLFSNKVIRKEYFARRLLSFFRRRIPTLPVWNSRTCFSYGIARCKSSMSSWAGVDFFERLEPNSHQIFPGWATKAYFDRFSKHHNHQLALHLCPTHSCEAHVDMSSPHSWKSESSVWKGGQCNWSSILSVQRKFGLDMAGGNTKCRWIPLNFSKRMTEYQNEQSWSWTSSSPRGSKAILLKASPLLDGTIDPSHSFYCYFMTFTAFPERSGCLILGAWKGCFSFLWKNWTEFLSTLHY